MREDIKTSISQSSFVQYQREEREENKLYKEDRINARLPPIPSNFHPRPKVATSLDIH